MAMERPNEAAIEAAATCGKPPRKPGKPPKKKWKLFPLIRSTEWIAWNRREKRYRQWLRCVQTAIRRAPGATVPAAEFVESASPIVTEYLEALSTALAAYFGGGGLGGLGTPPLLPGEETGDALLELLTGGAPDPEPEPEPEPETDWSPYLIGGGLGLTAMALLATILRR